MANFPQSAAEKQAEANQKAANAKSDAAAKAAEKKRAEDLASPAPFNQPASSFLNDKPGNSVVRSVNKGPYSPEEEANMRAKAAAAVKEAGEQPADKVEVYNLTSQDRFVLKDTNNDSIPDVIVVERFDPKADAAAKEKAKYDPYVAHIAAVRADAARANAGKSVIEIEAAENVAEAQAKKAWEGPVPPSSKADEAAKAADKANKEYKEAIAAERERLNDKKSAV